MKINKKFSEKEKNRLLYESYDEGMFGIPPLKKRNKMSIEDIAKMMAGKDKDTPLYILLSHELNVRLVKKQSHPIYLSILFTFIGIFVGWLLSLWHPTHESTPTPTEITSQHIQENHKSDTRNHKEKIIR